MSLNFVEFLHFIVRIALIWYKKIGENLGETYPESSIGPNDGLLFLVLKSTPPFENWKGRLESNIALNFGLRAYSVFF